MEPASLEHKDKLYLVTHKELSSGYQTAQIAHVVAEFILNNPDEAKTWNLTSNSVIVLEADSARHLYELQESAAGKGMLVTEFREPDLGDEITALAFGPSENTRKLLSNLRCAGRNISESRESELRQRERKIRDMSFAMMDCEQTEGQNVLQHGRSVREHYFALISHLRGEVDLSQTSNWRLPSWLADYRIELLSAIPDRYVMDRYLTLHDCGKPSVLEVDDEGKRHFPMHAQSSQRTYNETFSSPDASVSYLIEHDMDIHLLSAVDVPPFVESGFAIAQLLSGLAELTSNAAMFGGIESTGFKMKYKRLDQRGKAICKVMFENGAE